MNIVAMCPNCHTSMLIQGVMCVRCGRLTPNGKFAIAPEGSLWAGKPLCWLCIDGRTEAAHPGRPSEYKGELQICPP